MKRPTRRLAFAPSSYDNRYDMLSDELDCEREYGDEMEEYCKKLEKALDKACVILHDNTVNVRDECVWLSIPTEAWKEYLLKDE